jgi:hypothetical protein
VVELHLIIISIVLQYIRAQEKEIIIYRISTVGLIISYGSNKTCIIKGIDASKSCH